MTISVEDFRQPQQMLELEGGELAYWRFGSGPDVVFVHGWPLHGATWRNVIAEMSDDFTCHVFDLPGTGHTSWRPEAPFGFWEHAQTLAEALDLVGLKRYALVGHDSGATMTRLLDSLRPGCVTAHVMGNTEIPGYIPFALRSLTVFANVPGLTGLVGWMAKSDWMSEKMFESCFIDPNFVHGEFGELFVDPLAEDREYLEGQMRLAKTIDLGVVANELEGVHRKITAPVLLLWGLRDPWFPWRQAESMVDSFGGPPAEVELFEDARLFVHEERASEFGQKTAAFLKRTLSVGDDGEG